MDEGGPTEECEVCGGTDFYKEAGHFYCNECQTQSQQIREQVFEQEAATINIKSMKKIQKDKAAKEDKLTTWECYNIILKKLTEELIALGAKSEIKSVVRCLWMKYLHKCEVFDLKSNRPPKVSVLGSKKDVEILYNVKRRKRKRSRTSSASTTVSVRRQRSSKRRALIKSQHEDLSQSQTLTQDSSMVGETLSSLKTGSDSDSNAEIGYNRYSNAQLKRIMSRQHYKEHKHDVLGEMSCHKFSGKTFPGAFVRGPTILTPFTLYSILYIGLLIVEDDIQLGDLLRFIREGHLSFGSYRHFFDEDLSDKSLNLPKKNDKLFTSEFFRQKTASLVHFLKIEKYVKMPNLIQLCSRYCKELNLPANIFENAEKLIIRTAPQMHFEVKTNEIPNYEGRALSFILFTLKLLFGLDGVTEYKLSDYARILNSRLVDTKMFILKDWLIYIRHRDNVMKTYHMPYSLKNDGGNVDSDMYLNYIKNQEIKCKSTSKHIANEVNDYLQILEKLVDSEIEKSTNEARFRPSLTPFLSYISILLDSNDISCENVLTQSFGEDSLDFILRPNKYLQLAGNETVKNGGANDNMVIKDALNIDIHVSDQRNKSQKPVTVKVSEDIKKDKFIKEHLDLTKRGSLKPTDAGVFLCNWQQGNQKKFLRNRVLLELASENVKLNVKQDACNKEIYAEHYNSFERYWLNIPNNPTNVRRYITKSRVQHIMSELPHSLKIILNEFTRIAEQYFYDFYSEFLVTELNLVYFERYCSKSKKTKVPGIQKVLKDCLKKW